MALLDEPVSLHDVANVEAFVQATINRARLVLTQDERDELVAEGVAIMVKLAADWEPQREGYEGAGRFSGYAAQFLPRKLGDAWHRAHPEHTLRTEGDGKRRWHYGERAVSVQALLGDDGEDRQGHDALITDPNKEAPLDLKRAVREHLEEVEDTMLRVAEKLGDGLTSDREIAAELDVSTEQVREARALLQPPALRLRTLNGR